MKKLVIVALAFSAGACATPTLQTPNASPLDVAREAALQRKYVIEKQRDQTILLSKVMHKLSIGAAAICPDHLGGLAGLTLMSAKGFGAEYQSIVRTEYGLDDGLTVVAVVPGSPAFDAGLQPGDHIVSVDGTPIKSATDDGHVVQENLKRAAESQTSLEISVRRGNGISNVAIIPTPACVYPAEITNEEEINAYSDGEKIFVPKGMMNFVRSEGELALVLSHEMSHNVLQHVKKKRENALLGGAAGLAIDIIVVATTHVNPGFYQTAESLGRMAFSVEFEQEADYEGLYIMRRAGYPVRDAAEFWRQFAAENPGQITIRTTHPTSAERFVALTNAVNEIETKESKGLALIPEPLPGQPPIKLASLPAAMRIAPAPATAIGLLPSSPNQQSSIPTSLPAVRERPASVQDAAQTTAAPAVSAASFARPAETKPTLIAPPPVTAAAPPPAMPTLSSAVNAPVRKLSLGIMTSTVTRESVLSVSMADPHGAVVTAVARNSAGDQAGLKYGDVIQTFNNHRVSGMEELDQYLSETAPGIPLTLGVWRRGQVIVVLFTQ